MPERIFSIIMHPMETKMLVFVGDKWGKIGIRDVVSRPFTPKVRFLKMFLEMFENDLEELVESQSLLL